MSIHVRSQKFEKKRKHSKQQKNPIGHVSLFLLRRDYAKFAFMNFDHYEFHVMNFDHYEFHVMNFDHYEFHVMNFDHYEFCIMNFTL
jgi:hypothetical protein